MASTIIFHMKIQIFMIVIFQLVNFNETSSFVPKFGCALFGTKLGYSKDERIGLNQVVWRGVRNCERPNPYEGHRAQNRLGKEAL